MFFRIIFSAVLFLLFLHQVLNSKFVTTVSMKPFKRDTNVFEHLDAGKISDQMELIVIIRHLYVSFNLFDSFNTCKMPKAAYSSSDSPLHCAGEF
jgi:hypothetical protein